MIKLVRFLAVGVFNTVLGLALIFAAMKYLMLGPMVANSLGYSICIIISFFLNRSWTFAHQGIWTRALLRWLLVVGTAYACNLAVVSFVSTTLKINPYLAQLCGATVYTVLAFAGGQFFAFVRLDQDMVES